MLGGLTIMDGSARSGPSVLLRSAHGTGHVWWVVPCYGPLTGGPGGAKTGRPFDISNDSLIIREQIQVTKLHLALS